jgi:predicted nucleic acid-binding protein
MAEGGDVNVLVSGDKRGVLMLKSHGACRIVTVREFVNEMGL